MAKKTVAEATQKGAKAVAPEERGPTIEDRFAEFSARYKWYFIAPIAAIIVVVIVLAIVSGHKHAQRKAALEALRTAKTTADYENVAKTYPGTFAGRQALVRAGEQLFREGKYAEARAEYESFLATRPDTLLAIPVRTAVVQTYIREGNYTAAIDACNALLDAEGRQYAERQAMFYIAFCYEKLGNDTEAKTWYEKVSPSPQNRWDTAMERPWWALGWQRLNELRRRLEPKPRPPAEARVIPRQPEAPERARQTGTEKC
jgi:tetratricopeptide (TPR) repeat protein